MPPSQIMPQSRRMRRQLYPPMNGSLFSSVIEEAIKTQLITYNYHYYRATLKGSPVKHTHVFYALICTLIITHAYGMNDNNEITSDPQKLAELQEKFSEAQQKKENKIQDVNEPHDNPDAQKDIPFSTPLSTKIPAAFAAAAPLLVCPPVMALVVPSFIEAGPYIPTLAKRSIMSNLWSEPLILSAKPKINYLCSSSTMPSEISGKVNFLLNTVCSYLVSSATTEMLTNSYTIPQAPPANTLSQTLTHSALSWATSTAAQGAMRSAIAYSGTPITPQQSVLIGFYNMFKNTVNNHYTAKEKLIIALRKKYPLSPQQKNTALSLYNHNSSEKAALLEKLWNPQSADDTKHIQIIGRKEKVYSVKNEKNFSNDELHYYILQHQSGIVVSEMVIAANTKSVSQTVSKYDTKGSSWLYSLPLPYTGTVLRPVLEFLKDEVQQNHVSILGIPLKDLIGQSTDIIVKSDGK